MITTEQNNVLIEEIARVLSINHYNLSLSTKNPDYLENQDVDIKTETIFKGSFFSEVQENSKEWKTSGFARNILIIGSGASKNADKDLLTAQQFIKKALEDLHIINMLTQELKTVEEKKNDYGELIKKKLDFFVNSRAKNKDNINYQAQRFFSDAFHYLRRIEDYSLTLNDLLEKLSFEGVLIVTQNFVTRRELTVFLQSILRFRFIPNLFYELVAHLFKHRFIDVIINLNFDELLDNAIEDEMGNADWIKIYNEATCPRFEKALIDERLRIPLYIKPHGTISNLDSLLYSHSQYIDLSPSIKAILKNVFVGNNCEETINKNPIRQFNIISVGYSMNDPDIVAILYKNLSLHGVKKVNGLGDKKKITTVNTTIYLFKSKREERNTKQQDDPEQNLKKRLSENKNSYKLDDKVIKTVLFDKDEKGDDNINQIFFRILLSIQGNFRRPFIPSGPARHLWNVGLVKSIKSHKKKSKSRSELLLARLKLNLLFEFIKFNGKIPVNCVYSDRVGKYYKLFVDECKKHKEQSKITGFSSPIDYLNKVFNETDAEDCIIESEYFIEHAAFYNACYSVDGEGGNSKGVYVEKVLTEISNITGVNKKSTIGEFVSSNLFKIRSELYIKSNELLSKLPYGTSHEIEPAYKDHKHFKFSYFDSRYIINTNLSLTWHFYYFTIVQKDKWDKLIIVSNTGKALFNLYEQDERVGQENYKTYFEEILNDSPEKEVIIYHSVKKPRTFFNMAKNKFCKKPFAIEDNYSFKDNGNGYLVSDNYPTLMMKNIEDHLCTHKTALFIKNDEPVMGIYFFNPPNKSRINPIWFDIDDNEETTVLNKKNLTKIYNLISFKKTSED